MLKNKKNITVILFFSAVFLFFLFSASPVWAGDCQANHQNEFSFSSFLNPVASLVEKVARDFGYNIALASTYVPGVDCGGATLDCFNGLPTAVIDWPAAPSWYSCQWPCQPIGNYSLTYHILTINGVDSWNTGLNNSYTVNNLANNVTYNWLVEAYYNGGISSVSLGFTNQPYGFFTTPNCAPPPPPPPGDFNLRLGGSVVCNSVPLSWTSSSGADAYRILRSSPRVDISPYQPYTALNFTDTTVSQNISYQYQIEAYNSSGTNRSNTINVDTPYCPPTLSFYADKTSIYQGQSVTLTWSSTYTISCTASSVPAQSSWSGSKALNNPTGQSVVPLPPPNVTYNLQCSGPGGSISGSVTINITPLFLPGWREIPPR